MWNWAGVEIFETLDELVHPRHTALLMWDFADGVIGNSFNGESLTRNTARLLEAARRHHVLTLYSRQNDVRWEDAGPALVRARMKQFNIKDLASHPRANVKESPAWEIVHGLEPRESDIVFEKFLPNAFLGTNFEWRLRKHGIKTIVLAGVSVETGIDGTLREALNRGYYAVTVRDCVGTRSEEMYRLALTAMEIFDIYDSSEIIEAWGRSAS
jgi:biuret amidohydrolase